jgi:hypothetical protein
LLSGQFSIISLIQAVSTSIGHGDLEMHAGLLKQRAARNPARKGSSGT